MRSIFMFVLILTAVLYGGNKLPAWEVFSASAGLAQVGVPQQAQGFTHRVAAQNAPQPASSKVSGNDYTLRAMR